jgi:hypothetical protein
LMAQRRVAAKTILLRWGGMDMARSKFPIYGLEG